MNMIDTLMSKLLNKNIASKQTIAGIKQRELKVLAERFTKRSFLTPKVLTGGAIFAGLWWIKNREEKVKEAEQKKPR